MELLTLYEEKLLVWYGCANVEFTIARLKFVAINTIDLDHKKAIIGLCRKLETEEYQSVYEDMFYDIQAEEAARKAATLQYAAVANDNTGYTAEYLLRH